MENDGTAFEAKSPPDFTFQIAPVIILDVLGNIGEEQKCGRASADLIGIIDAHGFSGLG